MNKIPCLLVFLLLIAAFPLLGQNITGPDRICVYDVVSLQSDSTGGVWRSGDESVVIVDSLGNVTGIGPGQAIISYSKFEDTGEEYVVVFDFSFQITVFPVPRIHIVGDTSFCEGSTVTLTVNTDTMSLTYNWNTGSEHPFIEINTGGFYSVTARTIHGCTTTDSITVMKYSVPVVSFDLPSDLCQGKGYDLKPTPRNGMMTWTVSEGANVIADTMLKTDHDRTGIVYVRYHFADSNGCSATALDSVEIHPLPVFTLTGGGTYCDNNARSLAVNTQERGSVYSWSTGSDSSAIWVSVSGNYKVTVTNIHNCLKIDSTTIRIFPQPQLSFTFVSDSICQGNSKQFAATVLNGVPGIYYWKVTGNGTISNEGLLTADTNGSGTLKVTCVFISDHGCRDSIFHSVHIYATPRVSIVGNNIFCENDTLRLEATGADTYYWDDHSTSRIRFITRSGVYYVVGRNENGCTAAAFISVTQRPAPEVVLSAPSERICQGNSMTLTATPEGGYWQINGPGVISAEGVLTASRQGEDTITVSYIYVDNIGCRGKDSRKITVLLSPVVTITGPPFAYPNQKGFVYTAEIFPDNVSFRWHDLQNGEMVTPPDSSSIVVNWSDNPASEQEIIALSATRPDNQCMTTDLLTVNIDTRYIAPEPHGITAKYNAENIPYILLYPNPEKKFYYQWYKNGEIIEGANKQFYYPPHDSLENNLEIGAKYRLYLSDILNTACGNFTNVFIPEAGKSLGTKNAAFTIRPNPAFRHLTLSVYESEIDCSRLLIQIFTVQGQLLQEEVHENSNEIELALSLSPGLYIVRLTGGDGTHRSQRFIIQ